MEVSMPVTLTAKQILTQYNEDSYTAFHAKRYAILLNILTTYISRSHIKVLDIGKSKLTDLIHSQFNKFEIDVDTLGFDEDCVTDTGRHYQFNLNDCQWKTKWRTGIPQYDVVVMAEVIEHLYTSPKLILEFLRTIIKPEGVLIIQTPNALALAERIKPIFGIHPYELIREDFTNPGHYREYTEDELRSYAKEAGFTVLHSTIHSYFDYRFVYKNGKKTVPSYVGALANVAYSCLPRGLKPGISIALRNSRGLII